MNIACLPRCHEAMQRSQSQDLIQDEQEFQPLLLDGLCMVLQIFEADLDGHLAQLHMRVIPHQNLQRRDFL